jgi:four helix bundle protein
MFDFEEFGAYKKAKRFHMNIASYLEGTKLNNTVRDQLYRASFSVPLNLAEGSGRFTKKDRRNFFVIARGSIFECVAVLDILKDKKLIADSVFQEIYSLADELSRILYAMIRNLSQTKHGN